MGTMSNWTPLDEISRVGIKYLNGDYEEVEVNCIVVNSYGQPLWITSIDEEGREVIILAIVVQRMTVISRREINGVRHT